MSVAAGHAGMNVPGRFAQDVEDDWISEISRSSNSDSSAFDIDVYKVKRETGLLAKLELEDEMMRMEDLEGLALPPYQNERRPSASSIPSEIPARPTSA